MRATHDQNATPTPSRSGGLDAAMAAQAAVALVAFDLQGKIVGWNEEAASMFGYPAPEILGRSFTDLAPLDDGGELDFWLRRLHLGETFAVAPQERPKQNGEAVRVAARVRPWSNPEGELLGGTAAFFPSSLPTPPVFAYLHHELRTPLAAILGFAEMMYDARQTSIERMQCIGRIRNEVKAVSDRLNEWLDLSRLEAGELPVRHDSFVLGPVLEDILTEARSRAWKSRLHLNAHLPCDGGIWVQTDAGLIRQILEHTLDYTVRCTPRGTIKAEFSLRPPTGLQNGELRCEVDAGDIGDSGATLFEAFPSRDPLVTGPSDIPGPGLALARRLARRLGGDLELRTGPVHGRRSIELRIPLLPGQISAATATETPSVDATALRGARVLLVEDAAEIQLLVSRLLKRHGAQVEIADDGEQAILRAHEQVYDLILMDLQLPEVDGVEAAARIRRSGYTGPIVALTAHALATTRDHCLASGFKEFLTKPVDAQALVETVRRYHHPRV